MPRLRSFRWKLLPSPFWISSAKQGGWGVGVVAADWVIPRGSAGHAPTDDDFLTKKELCEILRTFVPGTATLALGPVPLSIPGYEPISRRDVFDQAKAKDELEKAENPSKPIELLVHEKESSEDIGQLIAFQLLKAEGELCQLKDLSRFLRTIPSRSMLAQ